MLSGKKLTDVCKERAISDGQLAEHLAHGGMSKEDALSAVRNWKKCLYSPTPGKDDVQRLATALGVETGAISEWRASYRYAPMSARKARLVTELIAGREVQDALDLLTFTHKRAAPAIKKVLQNAIANADEQEADVDALIVAEARVDQAGRRIGTKQWFPKDRGRAHPIRKEASHIHITVSEG
ncbi:MAG: 50S ribosomal protein L22 [Planctomycetales bacterium]|nr:50S ribosomal protein L22 [Planctomycetales bacterium]